MLPGLSRIEIRTSEGGGGSGPRYSSRET